MPYETTEATPPAAPTYSVSRACKIVRTRFNSDPPAKNRSAARAVGLGRPLAAVPARLLDESLEQALVFARLGMPEDAQREAPRGVFQRFERAVVRARGLAQAFAEPAQALVVVRLHRRVVAEQGGEARPGLERDVVIRVGAGRVLVLVVADDLGQVLHQVPAEPDVQDLAPPADGEQR